LDPRFIQGTWPLNPWYSTGSGRDRSLEVAAYIDRLPPAVAHRRDKAEFSEVAWSVLHSDAGWRHRLLSGPLIEHGWVNLQEFVRLLDAATEHQPWAARPFARALSLDRWLRT
jgi:hypothetical protein